MTAHRLYIITDINNFKNKYITPTKNYYIDQKIKSYSLALMPECEIIDDLDFETQIKAEELREEKESEREDIYDSEMDAIIELQEKQKRNNNFRTWLNQHKINTNDHNLKDLKTRADTSLFRYTKKDGLYIDSDLIPQMVGEGWITEQEAEDINSIDILLEFYDNNPTNPNYA